MQETSETKKIVHEQDTVYVDEASSGEELSKKPPSIFILFWKEVFNDFFATLGICLLVIIFLGIYISAFVIERRMNVMAPNMEFTNVSPRGWQQQTVWDVDGIRLDFVDVGFPTLLGTDVVGRQIAPLMMVSARNSLNIGLAVAFMSYIIGITLGLISGYFGNHVDNAIMRITDTVTMLPFLMVMIALIAMLESRSLLMFIVILTAFTWMGRVRLVRAACMQQSNLDYVHACKTLGTRNPVIIIREVLPNIVDVVVANFVLTIATSIGIETGLTILGFGLGIEYPSLGFMINSAMEPVNLQFYRWVWAPAVVLVVVIVLCINFVGQALQRVADPRQRLV